MAYSKARCAYDGPLDEVDLIILRAVLVGHQRRGYPPSLRELCKKTGRSLSVVQYRVSRLSEDGYLQRRAFQSRSIAITRLGRLRLTESTLSVDEEADDA
jgi:DNA-binding Lrp family transcriptional regulator